MKIPPPPFLEWAYPFREILRALKGALGVQVEFPSRQHGQFKPALRFRFEKAGHSCNLTIRHSRVFRLVWSEIGSRWVLSVRKLTDRQG